MDTFSFLSIVIDIGLRKNYKSAGRNPGQEAFSFVFLIISEEMDTIPVKANFLIVNRKIVISMYQVFLDPFIVE